MNSIILSTVAENQVQRRFQAAGNAFIAILLFCIILLVVVVLAYHFSAMSRARRRKTLYARVEGLVDGNGDEMALSEGDVQQLFSRRGISVLSELYDNLGEGDRKLLTMALKDAGIEAYFAEQLMADNEDFLSEVVRLIGQMNLIELSDAMITALYAHRENVDIQYRVLLALSRLGCHEQIVKICNDRDFVQTLSFRSLQQILSAYAGDREKLYGALLNAPDHYIVRICIKGIGAEKMLSLADRVTPYLVSEDFNLVIDAVRALGDMRYEPSYKQIETLLNHPRWEVRCAAVNAIAKIGIAGREDVLIKALQDREWQVRLSAGNVLLDAPDIERVAGKVKDSGDRYALEMLEYMMQSKMIWRQA